MEEKSNVNLLAAGMHREAQQLIAEVMVVIKSCSVRYDVDCSALQGVGLVWESYKLDPYVQRLAECVFHFHEKVDDLLSIEEQIDIDVRSLESCPYSTNTFADILAKIQKMVDDLSLRQYSNLHLWVAKLDEEVEKRLASRLQAGIQAWAQALEGRKDEIDYTMDTDVAPGHPHKLGGEPHIQTIVHEIRITNQTMYVHTHWLSFSIIYIVICPVTQ